MINIIRLEILNFIIGEFKKGDVFTKLKYGDYEIDISGDYTVNQIKNGISLDVRGKRIDGNYTFSVTDIKLIHTKVKSSFWGKKTLTKEQELINELYDIFMKRAQEYERLNELKKNEHLLKMLPKDRQKQIIREYKLSRIIKEEE